MKTKQFTVVLVLFCVSVFFCAGCKNAKSQEKEETARPVSLLRLESGELIERIGYTGDIKGETEIRVFSPIPERIVQLPVKEGDKVKKGAILAVVRSDTLAQGVRQAAGGLDAARANLRAAEDQLERMRSLKGSGAVTSSQLLSVESQAAAAQAQVRQLEATLGQAQQRRGDAIIRSPIDGIVATVNLEVGDLAAPQIPIAVVMEMETVTIEARAPETDLPLLHEGQPVVFWLTVDSKNKYRAAVSRISPVLDRMSRTALLEVDYPNEERTLKPGMLVHVEVEIEKKTDALWAPSDALTVTAQRRDGHALYRAVVVKDGRAEERLVRVGMWEGGKVEILDGLSEGEMLVTKGQHVLADGDAVQVQGDGRAEKNQAAPAAPKPKAPSRMSDTERTE